MPRERRLEVDSRGRLVQVLSDTPAQAGHDVQLTLDLDVQRIAEDSLEAGDGRRAAAPLDRRREPQGGRAARSSC